jgi:hypothetical protein
VTLDLQAAGWLCWQAALGRLDALMCVTARRRTAGSSVGQGGLTKLFPSSEAETNIVTARQHAVVLDVLVGLRRAAQARTSIHFHFIAGVVLLWGRLVAERSALDEALVGDTERVGGSDRPATAGFSMMVMPERMMSACSPSGESAWPWSP